jgi:hypothetical protein
MRKILTFKELRKIVTAHNNIQQSISTINTIFYQKPKHPVLAAIIERGHRMDLKETFAALIVVDALKRLLKIHAARLATD